MNTKSDKNNELFIANKGATELVKEYGTPLYVFDEGLIEKICLSYVNALNDFYEGNGEIAYASKAFCAKEIYRVINKFGLSADVVSAGEIKTAISAGFPADKLTFHGNNKTPFEVEYAIKNGVKKFVIDSYEEVDLIQSFSEKYGVKTKVLVRINPGIEAHTHHYIQTAKTDSKFGFSASNGDAFSVIEYLLTKNNLDFIGLHCHIGSQIFEKKSFVLAVDKMMDFYKEILDKYSIKLSVLDLGGGFGIKYNESDPDLQPKDYADFIKTVFDEVKLKSKELSIDKPFLVFEPGRSIVGRAGTTLYTVGNVKVIKDVKNYVAIDGGMFDNPRFALYQAKYEVKCANKLNEKPIKKYSIAGKCCESGDLIAEDVLLPEIEKGDILAVFSTGAYNFSMASNYNRNLVPPVVFVKDGVSRLVVKGQTLEDIISRDI